MTQYGKCFILMWIFMLIAFITFIINPVFRSVLSPLFGGLLFLTSIIAMVIYRSDRLRLMSLWREYEAADDRDLPLLNELTGPPRAEIKPPKSPQPPPLTLEAFYFQTALSYSMHGILFPWLLLISLHSIGRLFRLPGAPPRYLLGALLSPIVAVSISWPFMSGVVRGISEQMSHRACLENLGQIARAAQTYYDRHQVAPGSVGDLVRSGILHYRYSTCPLSLTPGAGARTDYELVPGAAALRSGTVISVYEPKLRHLPLKLVAFADGKAKPIRPEDYDAWLDRSRVTARSRQVIDQVASDPEYGLGADELDAQSAETVRVLRRMAGSVGPAEKKAIFVIAELVERAGRAAVDYRRELDKFLQLGGIDASTMGSRDLILQRLLVLDQCELKLEPVLTHLATLKQDAFAKLSEADRRTDVVREFFIGFEVTSEFQTQLFEAEADTLTLFRDLLDLLLDNFAYWHWDEESRQILFDDGHDDVINRVNQLFQGITERAERQSQLHKDLAEAARNL